MKPAAAVGNEPADLLCRIIHQFANGGREVSEKKVNVGNRDNHDDDEEEEEDINGHQKSLVAIVLECPTLCSPLSGAC